MEKENIQNRKSILLVLAGPNEHKSGKHIIKVLGKSQIFLTNLNSSTIIVS